MMEKPGNLQSLINNLKERNKELTCLYRVEEILNRGERSLSKIFSELIRVLPAGWQYPGMARARIEYRDQGFPAGGEEEEMVWQRREIRIQDRVVGAIAVGYPKNETASGHNLFLEEEMKLLTSIADRVGYMIFHREYRKTFSKWKQVENNVEEGPEKKWQIILEMIKRSDKNLYIAISQKMLHFLSCNNVRRAKELFLCQGEGDSRSGSGAAGDINRPQKKCKPDYFVKTGEKIFSIAEENLNADRILLLIQKWMDEEKITFLTKTLEISSSTMGDIIDALSRFQHIEKEGIQVSDALTKGMRVSLVRRFFSDQMEFVKMAKNFIGIRDYFDFMHRIIYPKTSSGKLGGKSAGLFLADCILKKEAPQNPLLKGIKTPKTWHINSDGLMAFVHYNNLEGVMDQKYKQMDEIHVEYPNIIHIFKNSLFPQEMINGLLMALDDFGENPIIVRSSSLLEDRIGSSFSGKYKSLFLANQGSRRDRLDALTDAVAEVYASVFAPDPIEYRSEKGLLDFHEEMGIMIQQVVGRTIGSYFFPSFAGVAFSDNEFRWSSRIQREDGIIRMVPGLGTRAVDRVAEDYPILISPGKPNLRVNVTPDEVLRYSTKKIDVINLETNEFQTKELVPLLKEIGADIHGIENIVSEFDGAMVQAPTNRFSMDFKARKYVVTFDGLTGKTPFVRKVDAILKTLAEKMNTPVDIEFAHDGEDFYLLQCRPQSFSRDVLPAPIPQDIRREDLLFSTSRYVSNGRIDSLSHVVYIDPEGYSGIEEIDELKSIGRVVGRLNKLLPKKQFILMGPGRWGSRGDIKLGVNVTYSDINNTAALIEMAFQKGNYTPELSFGTHFFQDLVESGIRYIPLYPGDESTRFNRVFFTRSPNILGDLLPEFAHLAPVVRVIDIPRNEDGRMLQILMNGELEYAVARLCGPSEGISPSTPADSVSMEVHPPDYWKWRKRMAELIASRIDGEEYGVRAVYLIGSVKNATAGPGSDIDLLIHWNAGREQQERLKLWLDAWSRCLAEINRERTGYSTEELLDIHFITDQDVEKKTSFAVKINAVTDPAKPLPMKADQ